MDQRVQVVIGLIVRDLHHELSVKRMANLVNLSSSRLRHLFRKETGLSFAQYVKTRRLQKAKELVETTFLSMKEIMNRVGLHDKSHFAKDFKRAFGVTPAQHRARSLIPEGLVRKAGTMK
jgi:transcriptional regulator GlxA family with amidase domain